MARIIGRVNRIWLYSKLDDKLVEAAHLNPTRSPQKIIDQWIKDDPRGLILVFKYANMLAIYSTHPTKKEARVSKSSWSGVAAGDQGDGNLL